jgi:hypothetical protein
MALLHKTPPTGPVHEKDFNVNMTKAQVERFPALDEKVLDDKQKFEDYDRQYRSSWIVEPSTKEAAGDEYYGVHGYRRQSEPEGRLASIDAVVAVGSLERSYRRIGGGQDDAFTSYKSQVGNPPRTRWGDYGAAAVDGNSIWIAGEYIAHACDYTTWGGPFFFGGTGDNLLGTCGGAPHGPRVRAALGNWSTRISKLIP